MCDYGSVYSSHENMGKSKTLFFVIRDYYLIKWNFPKNGNGLGKTAQVYHC